MKLILFTTLVLTKILITLLRQILLQNESEYSNSSVHYLVKKLDNISI